MADAFPCDSDGPPRPPTFVQIRPPAKSGRAGRTLGMLGLGLALAVTIGCVAWRSTDKPTTASAVIAAAAPPVTAAALVAPPVPEDLYGKLADRAVDFAVA